MRKREDNYLSDLYTSTEELPIWNWWKLNETFDYRYVLKNTTKFKKKKCKEVFNSLLDEFIDKHGISEDYKNYLKIVVEIHLLLIEKELNNDSKKDAIIEIKKLKLKDHLASIKEKEATNISNFMVKDAIEESKGMYIDVHKISVDEYYTSLKRFKEKCDALNKRNIELSNKETLGRRKDK